jgi:hypothetical protein
VAPARKRVENTKTFGSVCLDRILLVLNVGAECFIALGDS